MYLSMDIRWMEIQFKARCQQRASDKSLFCFYWTSTHKPFLCTLHYKRSLSAVACPYQEYICLRNKPGAGVWPGEPEIPKLASRQSSLKYCFAWDAMNVWRRTPNTFYLFSINITLWRSLVNKYYDMMTPRVEEPTSSYLVAEISARCGCRECKRMCHLLSKQSNSVTGYHTMCCVAASFLFPYYSWLVLGQSEWLHVDTQVDDRNFNRLSNRTLRYLILSNCNTIWHYTEDTVSRRAQ